MPDVVDPRVTPTWAAIYAFIRETWLEKGHAPSQSEIQRHVGCSGASVQNANKKLREWGYIDRHKFEARSSRPTDMNVRLYRTAPPPAKAQNPWDSLADVETWETNPASSR